MVLLDLEKDFDTVWHEGLIYKLSELNFPIHLIKITQSYLRDRKFVVTANGTQYNKQSIEAGALADDTALYAASRSTRKVLHKLQEFRNLVIQFFEKWKLRVNVDKTELALFTQRNQKHRFRQRKEIIPDFKIFGRTITGSKISAIYLGVKLHFKLHHTSISIQVLKKRKKC